jgi:prepilin-type N-terminal cleavage/methylation domain-containing protein
MGEHGMKSGPIPREDGFTLVELMVVLGVLALIAGLAIPSWTAQLPHKRLLSAARELAGDIRLARAQAVSQNTPYFVCFSGVATYTVDRVDDLAAADCSSASTPQILSVDLSARFPGVQFQTNGVAVDCGTASAGAADPIDFNSDRLVYNSKGSSVTNAALGSPYQASGAIYLSSTDTPTAENYCIQVQGTIGTVRLYQWDGASWKR